MTRICIILAVFLVTSIFSMVEMWTEAEVTAMRQKHGDWHIAIQNVAEDESQKMIKACDIALSSLYSEMNADAAQGYSIGGKNAVLYGVEETYPASIMNYPVEGSYPQNEREVALSAGAKELFGLEVGDNITLDTPAGALEYTVSGFYVDDAKFNNIIDGICVYMNRACISIVHSFSKRKRSEKNDRRFETAIQSNRRKCKRKYGRSGDAGSQQQ